MIHSMTCTLPKGVTDYEITVESGLLEGNFLIEQLRPLAHRFVIITDDNVKKVAGNALYDRLLSHGFSVDLFFFPAGEEHKNRKVKEILEDQMFEVQCGRDTCLIAVGGGVVTDLGGYIAATYCRGIPLIMIPTSLLAMVDASIGGKNGVDVPYGKNLIGTFYQPKHVVIDPMVLRSMSKRELRNGLVEMIKHGLIADRNYFNFMKSYAAEFLSFNFKVIEKAIYDSCLIKKRIVEEDEKETGKRRLLNLGHTLAHAIEHLTEYQIAHGEAVAIGILIEGYISNQMGYLSNEQLNEIPEIFRLYDIPFSNIGFLDAEQLIAATILDKKSKKGKARYILLKNIGEPVEFDGEYCTPLDESHLTQGLNWYKYDLCRD